MKKIVHYIGKKKLDKETTIYGEKYTYHKISGVRNVVLFLIENINVVGIVCDRENTDKINIDLMETVWMVSPFLNFMLFKGKGNESQYNEFKDKIIWINSIEEVDSIEKFTSKYMRQFNRINWPLAVQFSKEQVMINQNKANLLSLSAGGAFVESNQIKEIESGDNVYLIIQFKEFKLYVDSTVIRISDHGKPGFAVEFHHVSKLTQNCIDSIIKDKLASRLLFSIDDIFEGGFEPI